MRKQIANIWLIQGVCKISDYLNIFKPVSEFQTQVFFCLFIVKKITVIITNMKGGCRSWMDENS